MKLVTSLTVASLLFTLSCKKGSSKNDNHGANPHWPDESVAGTIEDGPENVLAEPGDVLPAVPETKESSIEGSFVVVMKDNLSGLSDDKYVARYADWLANEANATVQEKYSNGLLAVSAKIPADQMPRVKSHDDVKFVENDKKFFVSEVQQGATFGLDQIDQRTGRDGNYTFTRTGQGVNVYIIDTGIRFSHSEFAGRIGQSATAVPDGRGAEDCNGHGTHVAASALGTKFGVAKAATLHAVRVLGCEGEGSLTAVLKGVDFVRETAQKPAVINMSLGGPVSPALDLAVSRAVAAGITVVVAAGNETQNACNTSPARVTDLLSVGAADTQERRAFFSNFGACVSIFAPGLNIESAGIADDNATAVLSGTSMAAPHVAGAAALLLQGNPALSPAQVKNQLTVDSTKNRLRNILGSPNAFLFTNP